MDSCFPGSVVKRQGKTAEEFLTGLFFATNGLMLQQVREITGLDTPVIQNWINRGWVQKTEQKRYSANHLARIMIINMLRDVTKLENIAALLTYINGSANCREDDIISESQLYIYICDILDRIDFETVMNDGELNEIIETTVADYYEPFPGAHEKLINGIKIILSYHAASLLKARGDKRLTQSGII